MEQTPISALLTSIERGFRFPDFPPLPALAMVDEGEDESFDMSQVYTPVVKPTVKGLNIRSREDRDGDRPVLLQMPLNR